MNIVVFINPQQEIHEFWEDVITNMSEGDKEAIEFALQLKEKKGESKVTAVAIGGEDADMALREALAMGVDHAALLKDDDPSTDPILKITAALNKMQGEITVTSRLDDVMKEVAKNVPHLIIVNKDLYNPRHMTIKGVYTAYKREIEEISL